MKHKTKSLLRQIEYKILSNTELEGSVLDLWGSRKSGYHSLIKGGCDITVVNISEDYGYDIKFDIQEKFPIDNESYDNVIAINVLEHIYKFQNVANESFRVLRKGWKFVCVVPFMFHVHGSPDDYFRYTKSALLNIFSEAGFDSDKIKITEMGAGVFNVLYQMICPLIPWSIIPAVFRLFLTSLDSSLMTLSNKYRIYSKDYCLGYFVEILK